MRRVDRLESLCHLQLCIWLLLFVFIAAQSLQMGQCCSAYLSRDRPEPNERTRLLALEEEEQLSQQRLFLQQQTGYDMIPDMNTDDSHRGSTPAQEKLKSVVQTTAEHLMDISSIRMLDRLENNYAIQRSDQYMKALETAPQDEIIKRVRGIRHVASSTGLDSGLERGNKRPDSVYSMMSTTTVAERSDMDRFTEHCSKVSLALKNIKAQPTDDLVVSIS
ncbi:hypothetical protein BASA61_006528 [Batrachochytrium salamandrivorans]|nr:hypothetical protein BASA61_006528 [Batrachochytrium salamandrivorans]